MMSTIQNWLRRHFYVVNLLLVGIVSIFLGLVLTNMLKGCLLMKPARTDKAVKPRRLPSTASKDKGPKLFKSRFMVASRNIFCSTCEPTKAAPTENKVVASALDATLLATYVCTDAKFSFAAIRVPEPPRVLMVGTGEKLADATVTKVEPKRVELQRNGKLEYLELLKGADTGRKREVAQKPHPAGRHDKYGQGIRKTGPNSYEVDRKLVEEFLSNAAMAGQGARIIPNMRDGKPNGFRLYAIRPNSVYHKLGIQNADVIHSINNQDITSPDKALELFTKLRGASHLTISLSRRGQPVTMDYTIR